MSGTLTPDVCIVGGGSAGLVVAAGAAQLGLDVVLVERALMGGDCLNYGCVPSKSLIAAARLAATPAQAPAFRISLEPATVDAVAVRRHVQEVIRGIAPHDSVERFEGLGVTVIAAEARFIAAGEVAAGGLTIRARRFVIASGSSPSIPPSKGWQRPRSSPMRRFSISRRFRRT